jgi:hypothetical protein
MALTPSSMKPSERRSSTASFSISFGQVLAIAKKRGKMVKTFGQGLGPEPEVARAHRKAVRVRRRAGCE